MSLFRYYLSIADLTLLLETDHPLAVAKSFLTFLKENGEADYSACYRRVEQLPCIPQQILYEDNSYRVHPDEQGGWLRSFFESMGDKSPYAVAVQDTSKRRMQIDYLERGAQYVSDMHNSFSHLGLENLLIRSGRLCLHAACVNTQYGGILFSGRSGIGKSTQADLWCTYRKARQINGDRPVLTETAEGWRAWGSPYAGSSECHINESCRVRAIVLLQQGPECMLRRLSGSEAFCGVWRGITVPQWDAQLVELACDLTMKLAEDIPVYSMVCTPDLRAVECLEAELGKE